MAQAVQDERTHGLKAVLSGLLGDRFKRSLMLPFEAGRFDVATTVGADQIQPSADFPAARSPKLCAINPLSKGPRDCLSQMSLDLKPYEIQSW
jgi:hypothetical protein